MRAILILTLLASSFCCLGQGGGHSTMDLLKLFGERCSKIELYHETENLDSLENEEIEVLALAEQLMLIKSGNGFDPVLFVSMYLPRPVVIYLERNDFERAENHLLKSIDLCNRILGKENLGYLQLLNKAKSLYHQIGKHSKAAEYMQETINVCRGTDYEKASDFIDLLNDLGALYVRIGSFSLAEKCYSEQLERCEDTQGKNSQLYARALHGLGQLYLSTDNFKKAEYFLLESKNTLKQVTGKFNPAYQTVISNLAGFYRKLGKFKEAERYYNESEEICLKTFGKRSKEYARLLNNKGLFYYELGKVSIADELYSESSRIYENISEYNSGGNAVCMRNYGAVKQALGDYASAERLIKEAIEIFAQLYGQQNPNYINGINALGLLDAEQKNYSSAIEHYLLTMKLAKKHLGIESNIYTTAVNNIAVIYLETGEYSKAEEYLLRALGSFKSDVDKSKAKNNLGLLYQRLRNYQKAEKYYLESLEIDSNLYGMEHPSTLTTLNNLGALCMYSNQNSKAKRYLKQALSIEGKTSGKSTLSYAHSLNSLGLLYSNIGNYQEANKHLLKALKIRKSILGSSSETFAVSLSNLALNQLRLGNFRECENSLLLAMNIFKDVSGGTGSKYLQSVHNLYQLYRLTKKLEKANQYLIISLSSQLQELNKNFSFLTEIEKTNCLVEISWKFDDFKTFQLNYYSLDPAVSKSTYDIELSIKEMILQSNMEMRKNVQNTSDTVTLAMYDRWLALNQRIASNPDPQIQQGAKYVGIGVGLEMPNDTLIITGVMENGPAASTSLSSGNRVLSVDEIPVAGVGMPLSEIISLLKGRENTTVKLSVQNADGSNKGEVSIVRGIIDTRTQATKDKEEADKLEKQLSRLSEEFKELREQVTWNMVQSELASDEAAIEFSSFQYVDSAGNWTDSTLYTALVLRPNEPYPHMVPLFEQGKLDALFDTTASIAMLYGRGAVPVASDATMSYGEDLYDLVWSPLDSLLKGVDRVYFSPSGSLHKLSFSAIPYSGDSLLSDRYDLNRVSSTAVLTRSSSDERPKDMVLFGGMNYSMDTLEMKEVAMTIKQENRGVNKGLPHNLERGGESWSKLPGAEKEVQIISALAKGKGIQVTNHTGNDALEERFKALGGDSPDIIHLATHGFFYPDPEIERRDGMMMLGNETSSFKLSDNPLNRAGILFSGANAYWNGQDVPDGIDNGVLTAKEATYVSLQNTELLVLSACETGLGEIKGSEGVFGLQRAFRASGADNLLMSLWKVPDNETAEFMEAFYGHYFSDNSIKDSYQHAQRVMRNKYPNDPFKWAGFVLMK